MKAAGAERFQQAVGHVRLGLVDLVDQHQAAVGGITAVRLGRRRNADGLRPVQRVVPVERPPERARVQKARNGEPVAEVRRGLVTFLCRRWCWIGRSEIGRPAQRAEQLGLGQTRDGVEMPEQVAGFGARIDRVRDESAAQTLGGGAGELGFADAGLAAHQQRPAGGQGRVDGANLA